MSEPEVWFKHDLGGFFLLPVHWKGWLNAAVLSLVWFICGVLAIAYLPPTISAALCVAGLIAYSLLMRRLVTARGRKA